MSIFELLLSLTTKVGMYVYKPYSDSPYSRGVYVGGGDVEAVASTLGRGDF